MKEKEFNLLEETWILVMTAEGKVEEHTLPDVLAYSHKYRRLAGELPTQDFALLRLLLAVLQTIVYRYDVNGEEDLLEDEEEALERWKSIWDAGCLPEKLIREYLNSWKERFWLFHPERPFYQVPEAIIGTEAGAAKLNGVISESNNKIRLFSNRTGIEKGRLSYAEAARWLIYLNGFDDTSAKPKGKGLPSVGAGWLGKIGIVFAEGDTLFETLMLNCVLLRDQENCWDTPRPVWEVNLRTEERTEIVIPDNQAELLTLQSRRILLKREQEFITGYYLLGGDFFSKSNAMNEQMTFWKVKEERQGVLIEPRRNMPEKQMWRDFSNLVTVDNTKIAPGIVKWVELLRRRRLLQSKRVVCFRSVAVQYGDKDFFVTDIFGDSVHFALDILEEIGRTWARMIQEEVELCDKAASIVGDFMNNLQLAAGSTQSRPDQIKYAREQFYYRIDVPFGEWLMQVDPEQQSVDADQLRASWRVQVYRIAAGFGRELLEQSGEKAFMGRLVKKDKNDPGTYYSASDAYNNFQMQIYRCLEMKKVREVLHGRENG